MEISYLSFTLRRRQAVRKLLTFIRMLGQIAFAINDQWWAIPFVASLRTLSPDIAMFIYIYIRTGIRILYGQR